MAVEANDITKRFKDVLAVDRVTFEVHPGEISGLLGPNGAGKTTTIRVLVTLLPPNSGWAKIFDLDAIAQRMASNLVEDVGVLLLACVAGIATSSRLLRRLSQ
ncbi:MAG TPA: ATP-binding cassette domain-containing protein [Candidatus Micrarchaeaceae archaeon]|nr:ATP-binding cassette domain-containing protein [Candidatus Micrarchaeaceae archaeon]